VHHPIYAGCLLILTGIPLALGSWWGLILLLIPALFWRMFNEEQLLVRDLPGYAAYKQNVKYRLIRFVW
jgi:protein-S-isoprenylcysteine O-methyltransferase Ste14